MRRIARRCGRALADRRGLTVLEVLLALAIFLIGSVSIIGLFAAASVLHADAVGRRTAAFMAQELLAQVQTMRVRDVYAKSPFADDPLTDDDRTAELDVYSVDPDTLQQAANFVFYPVSATIAPVQAPPVVAPPVPRTMGPILIGNEWIWYPAWQTGVEADVFGDAAIGEVLRRDLWGVTVPPSDHDDEGEITVLQPRTWYYVVDDQDPGTADWDGLRAPTPTDPGVVMLDHNGEPGIYVAGNPVGDFTVPQQGYLVIDEEWFRYDNRGYDGGREQGWFQLSDANSDGEPDRGWGGTEAVRHTCGTPVTIAREHLYYPGYYYTVQFYPANTTGLQAQVVVCVAHRVGNLFRAWTFRSLFTPTAF